MISTLMALAKECSCLSFFLFFLFLFWLCGTACGILVPQPRIKPAPPAVEAWTLNHWSAREVPVVAFLKVVFVCNL